jgi:hypothetical protein
VETGFAESNRACARLSSIQPDCALTGSGVGGNLQNMVTMTVFIKEPRYGYRFVQIRKEIFTGSNFPASALITVSNFARRGVEIEIQGVAVIGDECSDAKPAQNDWGAARIDPCSYSKLRKPKNSWSFFGIQSFE